MRKSTKVCGQALPFSFRNLDTNFFGAITPVFLFCVATLLNKSAKHVNKVSFRLLTGLYANTYSRNGRQK